MYVWVYLLLATVLEGDLKAPFRSLQHQGVGEGANPFPGLLHFTFDPYLIMLSVKQGSIKYNYLSFWHYSTWDWTQVYRTIGEHSNHYANALLNFFFTFYFFIFYPIVCIYI